MTPSPMHMSHICTIQMAFEPIDICYRPPLVPIYSNPLIQPMLIWKKMHYLHLVIAWMATCPFRGRKGKKRAPTRNRPFIRGTPKVLLLLILTLTLLGINYGFQWGKLRQKLSNLPMGTQLKSSRRDKGIEELCSLMSSKFAGLCSLL